MNEKLYKALKLEEVLNAMDDAIEDYKDYLESKESLANGDMTLLNEMEQERDALEELIEKISD